MVCSLDLPVRVADRPKKLPPYIVGLTATRTWTSRLHIPADYITQSHTMEALSFSLLPLNPLTLSLDGNLPSPPAPAPC